MRLTAEDFNFVVGVLSKSESDRVSLVKLLTDEETRDEILDCELLARAVIESPDRLPISPQLYFYILCRKVLRTTSVQSRPASDYVASLLDGFTRTARVKNGGEMGEGSMEYISDMMQALAKARTREAFLLRSHTANYALFVSGIFADNLEKRTRQRGAPDLSFYEAMGMMNFRAASEYREAKKFDLQTIYEELAGGFHEVRVALNDLAGRLFHFDSPVPVLIAN